MYYMKCNVLYVLHTQMSVAMTATRRSSEMKLQQDQLALLQQFSGVTHLQSASLLILLVLLFVPIGTMRAAMTAVLTQQQQQRVEVVLLVAVTWTMMMTVYSSKRSWRTLRWTFFRTLGQLLLQRYMCICVYMFILHARIHCYHTVYACLLILSLHCYHTVVQCTVRCVHSSCKGVCICTYCMHACMHAYTLL